MSDETIYDRGMSDWMMDLALAGAAADAREDLSKDACPPDDDDPITENEAIKGKSQLLHGVGQSDEAWHPLYDGQPATVETLRRTLTELADDNLTRSRALSRTYTSCPIIGPVPTQAPTPQDVRIPCPMCAGVEGARLHVRCVLR